MSSPRGITGDLISGPSGALPTTHSCGHGHLQGQLGKRGHPHAGSGTHRRSHYMRHQLAGPSLRRLRHRASGHDLLRERQLRVRPHAGFRHPQQGCFSHGGKVTAPHITSAINGMSVVRAMGQDAFESAARQHPCGISAAVSSYRSSRCRTTLRLSYLRPTGLPAAKQQRHSLPCSTIPWAICDYHGTRCQTAQRLNELRLEGRAREHRLERGATSPDHKLDHATSPAARASLTFESP